MIKLLQNKTISQAVLFFLLFAFLGVSSTMAASDKAKELYNEGLKAQKAGNIDAAILSYKAAIEEDNTYVDPYINLGAIYFEKKEYDSALEMFKKATERDKTSVEAFANLGRVEYKLKHFVEAIDAFKTAIANDGKDASLYKDLAKVYFKKGNYSELVNTIEKCHELGGGDYLTYYMLGKGYYKTGEKQQAIAAYKKSIEKKSNYASAHFALGQIYLSQEKYKSAAKQFNAALKADPKNYRAAYNYAIAVQSQDPEAYDTNIAAWNKFLKVAKKNPKAKKYVSQATETIKQLKDAKEKAALQ